MAEDFPVSSRPECGSTLLPALEPMADCPAASRRVQTLDRPRNGRSTGEGGLRRLRSGLQRPLPVRGATRRLGQAHTQRR